MTNLISISRCSRAHSEPNLSPVLWYISSVTVSTVDSILTVTFETSRHRLGWPLHSNSFHIDQDEGHRESLLVLATASACVVGAYLCACTGTAHGLSCLLGHSSAHRPTYVALDPNSSSCLNSIHMSFVNTAPGAALALMLISSALHKWVLSPVGFKRIDEGKKKQK